MEEKKKGNGGLIILIVILLLVCVGMGCFIFINKDKLMAKETTEVSESKDNESENNNIKDSKEESTTQEDTIVSNETANDNRYTEKVYSMDNNSFIFFKSGNCVIKSNLEYTAHCKYYIENNVIHITSRSTGTSRGDEHDSAYNIVVDNNNDEYIELSTNNNKRYKYLKDYS